MPPGTIPPTLRRALLVVALSLAAVLVVTTSAAASAAYATGTSGYDYSYPQCGASAPSRAAFGVIGVNDGRPFHFNPCFSAEYAAALRTGAASLYINTGYDPVYTDASHTTTDCVSRSAQYAGDSAHQAAWAAGCSEAQTAMAFASGLGATAPRAWWLDVETANSWANSDLSLNDSTLQGIVDTVRAATPVPVGIYSTGQQWSTIAGAYPLAVDADWVATGTSTLRAARTHCSHGFTGAPVWLVQWVSGIDRDYAC